jgi:hypothetical protein
MAQARITVVLGLVLKVIPIRMLKPAMVAVIAMPVSET